jgi:hypothetical protein
MPSGVVQDRTAGAKGRDGAWRVGRLCLVFVVKLVSASQTCAPGNCLARLFSSCTALTTMAVAEKDRVFRHFMGTIVSHERLIPA